MLSGPGGGQDESSLIGHVGSMFDKDTGPGVPRACLIQCSF